MKLQLAKLPALLLALLVQCAPLLKLAQSSPALAVSPLAIVVKWAALAAVAVGGYHAVSGASVVLITSPTNSVATNGTAYKYTITQNSPNPDNGHVFTASPRPSNLTLTVIQGAAPAIANLTGTPTNFGVWLVHLTATYNDGSTILSAIPTNMLLTVYGKPIITNQPASLSANAGGSASFSVVAGALPSPTYRWRFGTSTLAGQTNATLNLTNVMASDAGGYTVVVSNSFGSVTSVVATLTVNNTFAPGIVTQPHDATVLEGGTTNFSVMATGAPNPVFLWYKNGTFLPGPSVVSKVLSNVTTNDAGPYIVIVSNTVSWVTSVVATLTVIPRDGPALTTPPHDAAVFVGGATNFSVLAAGTPPLSYFWLKDGAPIGGANAATNQLNNVTTNDAGGYSVIVSNVVNSVTSAPARLFVVREPVITSIGRTGDQVALQFPQDAGGAYEMLFNPALSTNGWLSLTNFSPLAQSTNVTAFDASTNEAARFYKLRVTLP